MLITRLAASAIGILDIDADTVTENVKKLQQEYIL
jgi:hypothetical protein